jgi:hypothetical protein
MLVELQPQHSGLEVEVLVGQEYGQPLHRELAVRLVVMD